MGFRDTLLLSCQKSNVSAVDEAGFEEQISGWPIYLDDSICLGGLGYLFLKQ